MLTANASGPKHEARIAGRDNIGQLLSPAGWRQPSRKFWACDNDVFGNRHVPDWWTRQGESRWLKMLDKAAQASHDPMWVLLPDVVADWPQTIERAWRYLTEAMERDLRYAVALQDGCDFREALALRPFAVFIGGTTRWKWLNAESACRYFQPRGVKVHVGRVSGPLRVRECLRIGVDSCDGTGWNLSPDAEYPRLWWALDGAKTPQQRLLI